MTGPNRTAIILEDGSVQGEEAVVVVLAIVVRERILR